MTHWIEVLSTHEYRIVSTDRLLLVFLLLLKRKKDGSIDVGDVGERDNDDADEYGKRRENAASNCMSCERSLIGI